MIKSLIIDDEKPARDELRYILEKIGQIEVVGEGSNAMEALKLNEDLKPDLIFLDIKMPQISGIDVARILMDKKKAPKIIFVTAFDKFALEAFKVNAIDYILKPIDEEEIVRVLENKVFKKDDQDERLDLLMEYIERNKKKTIDKITLHNEDKMIPIKYSNIVFITVEDKLTTIYAIDGRYTSYLTLNDFVNKLPRGKFFRSHKSFILNLEHIELIEPWFNSTLNIKLRNYEHNIPVSRNYVKEFKEIMNIE